MLHLIKLAVGARDVSHLRAWQEDRVRTEPDLRHRTRHFPRRAAEIVEGGSMYWVVAGAVLARQRVIDVVEDIQDDGSACAAIVLEPKLVAVAARRMKPFQGWRYLAADDAPRDLDPTRIGAGEEALPPGLARALRELCL